MAGCAAKICGSKSLVTKPCHSATGRRNPLREGHFGHMRTYPCVSLARRNAHVGLHDNERHSRQAERVRLHDLAPPGAKLRGIAHEKSRVATQLGGKGDQLRLGKTQAEKPVERQQYGGAVGRTAPSPAPKGTRLSRRISTPSTP